MKMILISMKMKLHAELIFIWKVSHLDSFWNKGTRELGNGLLKTALVKGNKIIHFAVDDFISIFPSFLCNCQYITAVRIKYSEKNHVMLLQLGIWCCFVGDRNRRWDLLLSKRCLIYVHLKFFFYDFLYWTHFLKLYLQLFWYLFRPLRDKKKANLPLYRISNSSGKG